MVSPVTAAMVVAAVFGLLVAYIFAGAFFGNKGLVRKAPWLRGRALIRTEEYGSLIATKGRRITEDTFVLWMKDKNGHVYSKKMNAQDIHPLNKFQAIVGPGAAEWAYIPATTGSDDIKKFIMESRKERDDAIRRMDEARNTTVMQVHNREEIREKDVEAAEKLVKAAGRSGKSFGQHGGN